jgi:hypothetical protein
LLLRCPGFANCIRDNQKVCDICGKTVKGKVNIWCHKLSRHNVLVPECYLSVITCPECGYRCLRQTDHEKHMRKHLPKAAKAAPKWPDEPLPHACDKCPYSAATRSSLKSHKARKHRQRPRNEEGEGSRSSQGPSMDPLDAEQCDSDGQDSEEDGDDSSDQ